EPVMDRTLHCRQWVVDYQRQKFLIDHVGLSTKTVLEQIDLFGENVLPTLRKEFAKGRPEDVPPAPTHEFLKARHAAGNAPIAGGGVGSEAHKERQQAQAGGSE